MLGKIINSRSVCLLGIHLKGFVQMNTFKVSILFFHSLITTKVPLEHTHPCEICVFVFSFFNGCIIGSFATIPNISMGKDNLLKVTFQLTKDRSKHKRGIDSCIYQVGINSYCPFILILE